MKKNERQPAVVIYNDEDVLYCLQQELVNEVIRRIKRNEIPYQLNEEGEPFFEDKSNNIRLSIFNECAVFLFKDFYDINDEFEQIRLSALIDEKKRELAELENKLNTTM